MTILADVKNGLGEMIDESFDDQLLSLINIAITPLTQVGALVELSNPIDSNTEWDDIVETPPSTFNNNVKSAIQQYTYLNVKLLFDPPVSGVIDIFKEKSNEMLWRIKIAYTKEDTTDE